MGYPASVPVEMTSYSATCSLLSAWFWQHHEFQIVVHSSRYLIELALFTKLIEDHSFFYLRQKITGSQRIILLNVFFYQNFRRTVALHVEVHHSCWCKRFIEWWLLDDHHYFLVFFLMVAQILSWVDFQLANVANFWLIICNISHHETETVGQFSVHRERSFFSADFGRKV